ncbi:molybdopterin-guanine dinucleotide biosynthesis protein B [Salinarimonas soli]|uniref:Molybdopterin-guanine dinucleotide biosynthesis protein B n=1 Tax=Salinarimonas soli TaxID=1638099 RepID=A0A5B2VEW8_9HYPH|nr:molybdopterin-guanine dinucleotide biosynthesis protein B [Salinarimonas soli]KAA2237166.1 molybdopterin-guanine dinucleotide biosynthesis protein B [Salinarimonas soli]
MRVIGLAGWSGAGKTTLLTRLIPILRERGLRVSTLKHAHHAFDIDRPGKDSYEHREAGASEVLIASARRWALLHELRAGEPEPPLAQLLAKLAPVDLAIVEGFKTQAHPKIEVHRAANGKPPLYPEIANVRAIASDVPIPDAPVPVLHLDDLSAIADAVQGLAMPLAQVTELLARDPGRPRLPEPRP